ncbi:hypothetical protein WME90_11095 [Sorangium sp. So ce375]|uniref:hypothetical protein n=1 Tax=Sorangium sp. So ce375 TaxID=3133306 RepID=UPI003F5CBC56
MSPDGPVSLVFPCGAIGLVGGWLTADSLDMTELVPRCLLAGVTPIVAALLGHYLTPRIGGARSDGAATSGAGEAPMDGVPWVVAPQKWTGRGPMVASVLVVWAIVVAGVVNGMTIGLVAGPAGMIIGAAFGAVFALPFVPALAVVLFAASRVGRARAGSIVALSDRRAVWAATAAVIAVALQLGSGLPEAMAPDLAGLVATMGFAVVGGLCALDAAALVRVLKLPRERTGVGAEIAEGIAAEIEAAAMEEATGAGEDGGARSAARAGGRGTGERIDLGLGDEVEVEVVRPTHAYRGAQQIARVVLGNRERAVAALRAGLVRGAAALAIGAVLWGQMSR